MDQDSLRSLELRSCVTPAGELVLSLEETEIAPPGPDDVVVQVQAAPSTPPTSAC